MQKVLLLHAVNDNPQNHWYPWLKVMLEKKDIEVHIPQLPGEWNPKMSIWKKIAIDAVSLDKDTTVIGHSLGAVLGLRLAEEYPFKRLILVAGWDFNSLAPHEQTFWNHMTDHAKIRKNVDEIVVVTSDNDPYTTATIAKEMADRLGAKYELIKGVGHFLKEDGVNELSAILKYF